MTSVQASRVGRERTFIGNQCATCEEPLELTLRGERILQLTCGHVSHEVCFYEYIKEFQGHTCPTCDAPLTLDASRRSHVDFQNLTKFVESSQPPEPVRERMNDLRSATPGLWDLRPVDQTVEKDRQQSPDLTRHSAVPEYDNATVTVRSREPSQHGHGRSDSGDTAVVSTTHRSDVHSAHVRKHDYDVQCMEAAIHPSRLISRNPIPAPSVTIRSEFPTITKSRQQQSLTCLVTVEVLDGQWQPDMDDLGPATSNMARTLADNDVAKPLAHHNDPFPEVRSTSRAQLHKDAPRPVDSVHGDQSALEEAKENLFRRVENWHGLDFLSFGKLSLHGLIRVAKDGQSWQVLECYLFAEMLICVKEKRPSRINEQDGFTSRCTLKGSILVKKHLKTVETVPDAHTLTLSLSVAELPQFHLQFLEQQQMEMWRKALLNVTTPDAEPLLDERNLSAGYEEEYHASPRVAKRASSAPSSSYAGSRSCATAPTEYSHRSRREEQSHLSHVHVPIDVVVVVPISSSMQGLKIDLLRDALRFMVASLGDRDRMGLVTFGSSSGGVPLVGMTNKTWDGWSRVIDSIRPLGQKSLRADVVEGANAAVDLLMQRRYNNPLSSVLLISDATSTDQESIDFVVSRAEAAKIGIHSFGLGLTHKPDSMVEMSTRTKASYTYVKDWMLLRECLAGALGSLQSSSHQNVKLKLRLPEGSPAKFVKISGALQVTKRATGRDAEVVLGDLRFGDKRDILVQLSIPPDAASYSAPTDAWDNVIAGLEALGGSTSDHEDARPVSIEEVALLQADLSWNDLLRESSTLQLPHPGLLTITVLPPSKKPTRSLTPPIPPHPSVVQRRMELLTSDMLSRSLTLVARGQPERASHLLAETRSILKGLGKGGLPPLPPPTAALPPTPSLPPTPRTMDGSGSPTRSHDGSMMSNALPEGQRTPTPPYGDMLHTSSGIDAETMRALDLELEASREWMAHPAIFSRDARKAVLQAIGTISTQRSFTFRTPTERLWATRVSGIKRLTDFSRTWRDSRDNMLAEEA